MDLLIFEPDTERAAAYLAVFRKQCQFHQTSDLDSFRKRAQSQKYLAVLVNLESPELLPGDVLYDVLSVKNKEAFVVGLIPDKKSEGLWKQLPLRFIFIPKDTPPYLIKMHIQFICGKLFKKNLSKEEPFLAPGHILKSLVKKADLIMNTDVYVLMTGETGTGKTALARYIHTHSTRRDAPFMHINCAAIPEYLLEAELFGYKKGAFTGAQKDTEGKFKATADGTILLDEIGEIPSHLQAKLLKVLDEKEYYPLGSTKPEAVKARIIAATNKNIAQEVQTKRFRQDLYYRLNTFEIYIPPLRERPEEIPAFYDYFLNKEAQAAKLPLPVTSTAVYEVLKTYAWPGNIRELQNIIKTIILEQPQHIELRHLPTQFFNNPVSHLMQIADQVLPLEQAKTEYVKYIYKLNDYNKKKTARVLQIDVKTLRRLLNG